MGEFGESGMMSSDQLGVPDERSSQPVSELVRRGNSVIDTLSTLRKGRVEPNPIVYADWVTEMQGRILRDTGNEKASGVVQVNGYADARIDHGGNRIGDREFVGRYLKALGAHVPVTRLGGTVQDREVGWDDIGWIADNATHKRNGISLTSLPSDFVGVVTDEEGKSEWLVMGTHIDGVRLAFGGSSVSNPKTARDGGVVLAQPVFLFDSGLGHDKGVDSEPADSPLIGWEPILP